jgi:hypothetical protein
MLLRRSVSLDQQAHPAFPRHPLLLYLLLNPNHLVVSDGAMGYRILKYKGKDSLVWLCSIQDLLRSCRYEWCAEKSTIESSRTGDGIHGYFMPLRSLLVGVSRIRLSIARQKTFGVLHDHRLIQEATPFQCASTLLERQSTG